MNFGDLVTIKIIQRNIQIARYGQLFGWMKAIKSPFFKRGKFMLNKNFLRSIRTYMTQFVVQFMQRVDVRIKLFHGILAFRWP